jgi:hypothetical protein
MESQQLSGNSRQFWINKLIPFGHSVDELSKLKIKGLRELGKTHGIIADYAFKNKRIPNYSDVRSNDIDMITPNVTPMRDNVDIKPVPIQAALIPAPTPAPSQAKPTAQSTEDSSLELAVNGFKIVLSKGRKILISC